jgi:PhzF family phenazine biosynthesis protein
MKSYTFFMVNAFGVGPRSGNPAGVCILDHWLSTPELQGMARQLNQPETAFVIPSKNKTWAIRWFSVSREIDLCGHATLAAAHCLFKNKLNPDDQQISFTSKSGELVATLHQDKTIEVVLPSIFSNPSKLSSQIVEGLGAYPESVWLGANYLCLFDSQQTIESLQPDFTTLLSLREGLGVIVTALSTSKEYDFVSRYFAPQIGINEDHATGAAHCMLVPFWSNRLRKTKLTALQVSSRGGKFYCENLEKAVSLRGNADTFLTGELHF